VKTASTKAEESLKAERLELVHTNVWGKASVLFLGGLLYIMTFIDDSTEFIS